MFQAVSVKDDGSYRFSYETGKEGGSHSRTEERKPDGVVIGKFSYEDPNGDIREVSYRADKLGYVANGDVGVEGAPKGQFPAIPDPQENSSSVKETVKPDSEELELQNSTEPHHYDESHKDEDIQDLSLEDSTVNDQPEAFPEGFFLQHFQGLRRLPEPTKKEVSSTQAPSTETTSHDLPQKDQSSDKQTVQPTESSDVSNEELNKINRDPAGEQELFMHLRPFQSFRSSQWAPSMFHQPVYVFSYQHPESYGYHYFY